jgi:hypothetical protein
MSRPARLAVWLSIGWVVTFFVWCGIMFTPRPEVYGVYLLLFPFAKVIDWFWDVQGIALLVEMLFYATGIAVLAVYLTNTRLRLVLAIGYLVIAACVLIKEAPAWIP